MGCTSSSEAAQMHHVLHHFPSCSIAKAEPKSPDQLQRVVGRALTCDPHNLMNAPQSGRRCIYWEIKVWEEFWPVGERNMLDARVEWRQVLTKSSHIDFKLVEEGSECFIPMSSDTLFRVQGTSFKKARDLTSVPENIQSMKTDDKNYIWGQTYTYAGGVQTGIQQTGHYKCVEAIIQENDLVTALCFVKEMSKEDRRSGRKEGYYLGTFEKESIFFMGTKGWTNRDRQWWNNIFEENEFRMVVSNMLADTDGTHVKSLEGTRCTFCSLVSSDPKITGLPNNQHERTCKLYARPSQTQVQPALSSGLSFSEEMSALAKKSSRPVKCLKGHPLKLETRRGVACSWCMVGTTQYHCTDAECHTDICIDCFDLTRDAGNQGKPAEDDSGTTGTGTLDLDRLERMVALAPMLAGQNRLEEAEVLYNRVYTGYRSLEGEESLDMLLAADGLAGVLRQLNKMEESEAMYRFVVKVRNVILSSPSFVGLI